MARTRSDRRRHPASDPARRPEIAERQSTRAIGSSLSLVSIVTLSACAPLIWDRPGTTLAELSMDRAQCQLYAEGVVPNFDAGTVATGRARRDLAINAGVAVIGAIAPAAAISQKRDLWMQAKG